MSHRGTFRVALARLIVATIGTCFSAQQVAVAQDEQPKLEEVVVTGVRAAERKAIDLKRDAPSIQDSIAAQDIGKLPDTTIADSLQRITGVQIDREAGEGTAVNIRGLPEVGTLLNGEAFLTTSTIVGVQPDFGDIPSQLFAGADVVKSPTASLLNAGISGTINLKTRRPYDLRDGWTVSASADGSHGSVSNKYEPQADALAGYHGNGWGVLVSAAYSKLTLEDSMDGMDQFGAGKLIGETSDSTTQSSGFLSAFGGAPIPSGITLLHPSNCTNTGGTYHATTPNGCDVDVNGDGAAKSAFFGTENFAALDRKLERDRLGLNASVQADLGNSFNLVGDFFYTDQQRYTRAMGYQFNSSNWNGATFVPLATQATRVQVYDGFNTPGGGAQQNQFFTTQRYQDYVGDIESYSEDDVEDSTSRNINLQLSYNAGGPFTADVRAIRGDASVLHMQSYAQFSASNGSLWPNEPATAAPPGTIVSPGGTRAFNPYGFVPNTIPVTVGMTGDHLAFTLPASLQSILQNENAYSLKTVASEGDYQRKADLNVLRADGHYKFDDAHARLDFGVRYSDRSADNTNFVLIAPVYGGNGAYNNVVDPTTGLETAATVPNSTGCYVRYKGVDVILDGGGVPGGCKAGNPQTGFYRAGSLSGLNPGQLPSFIANNMGLHSGLAGTSGVSLYALNPAVMDNVMGFQNALYPGEERDVDPSGTWQVTVKQTTGYLQTNYQGVLGVPFSVNGGVKIVSTDVDVEQHRVGPSGPYFVTPTDLGITRTDNHFTDVLPVVNLAWDLRDDLKFRLAYAKNMELLDLSQWGGGLTLSYGLVAGSSPPIYAVQGGSQTGNPNLRPWRSSNYDASLEYYLGRSSMISVAAFYIDVASFIANGSILRCDLPDFDGVVRQRCVSVNGPVQGTGKTLHGVEIDLKQAFDFLPGVLRNLGIDTNFTYSPSNVGTDVAGHSIPFQDNSAEQANVILWYQSKQFQARIAGNYRSKRAVTQNFGGIEGFEEYQAPTFYLDASVSYDFTPGWQVFLQGSNLTSELERYYLVWPGQMLHTNRFEARYTLGVRARF